VWPYTNLCIAHLATGDIENAPAAASRAVELRPDIPYSHFVVGHAYKYGGHFTDAARSYEKVIEVAPSDPWGHYHTGVALQYAGDSDRAREHFMVFKRAVEKWIFDDPDEIVYRTTLDVADIRLGGTPSTTYTEEQLASTNPNLNLGLAKIASLQGRTEDALALLEIALDAGLDDRTWIMVQPDFDPIRDDPRFQELKRRTLGLENG